MLNRSSKNILLPVLLVAPVLLGCTPSLTLFDSDKVATGQTEWEGPTVKVLVNHVTCELEAEYARGIDPTRSADVDLWKKLSTDHFVAAVDLNLLLTQIEGINPGYSAITPLNALGATLPIVTGTPPSTMFASGAYNRTLAVGAQLSGTQDNSVDLTYIVDMSRIADEVQNGHVSGMPDCTAQGDDGLHIGLRGDLQLGNNIDEVLTGIDASGGANVYSSTGPFAPDNISTITTSLQTKTAAGRLSKVLSTTEFTNMQVLSAKGKGGSGATASSSSSSTASTGAPSAAGSSSTGFSLKVDFTILGSINGGPSWTLLRQTYPAAAGSSGLVNYSRQRLDTLTMTFAPTCATGADRTDLTNESSDSSKSLDFRFGDIDPNTREPVFHVITGIDPAAFAAINVGGVISSTALGGGGLVYFKDNTADAKTVATVTWTGSVRVTSIVGNVKSFAFVLSGTVTKNSTQRPIGRLIVAGTLSTEQIGTAPATVRDTNLQVVQSTDQLPQYLISEGETGSFWDTLPPCDTMTGPTLQNIWDGVSAQAQLFKLTSSLNGH